MYKTLRAIVKWVVLPTAIVIAVAGVEAGAGLARAGIGIFATSTGVVVGTAPSAVNSFQSGVDEAELSEQRAQEQRAAEAIPAP